jgi:pimeloyl-ACP methyl ester carboxylesterase
MRRSTRMRGLRRAMVAVAVTAVTATAAAPAVAGSGPGDVPGDQPLPGYTVDNPPLAPALVDGQPTTVRQGVHAHAAYDIEVPPHWNGDLVMWAHGFRGATRVLTVDTPAFGLRQKLLDEGYAWAASSYAGNDYDVRTGVLSTHDLALLFGQLVGRPHRTYLVGVSMGGHVVGRSLEQYPEFYAAGLPMCGVLGDNRLFDTYLDYNVVAQALAGVRAYPPPPDYLANQVPRIEVALGLATLTPTGPDTTNALGGQLRAITIERTGGARPGAEASFAVWKDFLFAIAALPTGPTLAQNPAVVSTNVGRVYTPNSPVDVNAVVQRVPLADPVDRRSARLSQIPRILGRPNVPVLSLHGLGDLFVPFSMEEIYGAEVAAHHRSDLLVQRAIRTAGHCEFDAAEVGTAWDDLVRWVHTGQRPAGDAVTDPAEVAEPDFGCRFSDPAAFSAPAPGSSRRLFAPCPAG